MRKTLGGISTDIFLVITAVTLPWLSGSTSDYLIVIYCLAAPLQALTLYTIFRTSGVAPGGRFISPLSVLATGGFLWLFLPALAFDTEGWWLAFRWAMLIAIFGDVAAAAATMERTQHRYRIWEKVCFALCPTVYLALSELLVYAGIRNIPGNAGFAVLIVFLSYFPVRLLMLLRKPVSVIEVITGLGAFGYFIYRLIT